MGTAATILAAIDAAILAYVQDGKPKALSVSGKSITYASLDELRSLRDYYAKADAADSVAAGTKNPFKQFGIRFGRPV